MLVSYYHSRACSIPGQINSSVRVNLQGRGLRRSPMSSHMVISHYIITRHTSTARISSPTICKDFGGWIQKVPSPCNWIITVCCSLWGFIACCCSDCILEWIGYKTHCFVASLHQAGSL